MVLEAMHLGKPIVATSVGGIPEILTDDETGLLVPAQNPTRLASSLLNLTEDSEKRSRIGQAAKVLFEKRFTYKHMVESYLAIYQDLLNLK